MSDFVSIKSIRAQGGELRLRPCDRYSVYAEFVNPVVNASLKVSVLSPVEIILFLNDLAKQWRKGEGAKTWESQKGQMKLECSRDNLDHVFVRVILRDDFEGADWLAGGTLELAAGDLEQLAQAARRLLASPSHAV